MCRLELLVEDENDPLIDEESLIFTKTQNDFLIDERLDYV